MIDAVCVIVTPPATAVITALPDVKDLTVATNCPLAFVVPDAGVIVSVAPRLDDSVTLAPLTKLLFVSRTVTVIVLVAAPFATTLVGLAVTLEFAALTGGTVTVRVIVAKWMLELFVALVPLTSNVYVVWGVDADVVIVN